MSLSKLGMPKFGLLMKEGALVAWLVDEGTELSVGDDVAEVETDKINGVVEAPAAGVLRRKVANVGDVLPVGALLGVIADETIREAEIDAYVAQFQATFVAEVEDNAGPHPDTIDLGGRRLQYLRHGEGAETVLLVHGFGGDLNSWLFNHESLATGERTVYAIDLPGHGGSTREVGPANLDFFVDTVDRFINELELERIHAVGHSLGGAVVVSAALARPERFVSTVVIASAGLGREINAQYVTGFVEAESRRDLKPILSLLFSDESLVTRRLTEEVLRFKRLDGATEALRSIAATVFPDGHQAIDLTPSLGRLTVPILGVWGTEDRIIPVAHAQALAPIARVEVIEGVGHMPQMEAAGMVNDLVEEFIGGHGG
jgi:pyruvate dehydrogenase E2 component (dihydrolipoamide acetyltransferase)